MEQLKLAGDWAPLARVVRELPFHMPIILNLEGPVFEEAIDNFPKLPKAGPSIFNSSLPRHDARSIFILSNNHFMDYSEAGFVNSINIIKRQKGLHVGAGLSKQEARQPLLFDWNGKRVGLLARCEVQFGVAEASKAGVAGFDATLFSHISRLKREVDLVVVSIHAAAEMCPWPSPKRQDTYRALVDAGADIVHGHHSHVPQGWEAYNHGWIFYGLGNFCVDPKVWRTIPNALWSLSPEISYVNDNLLVQLETTVIDELADEISIRSSTPSERDEHQ